MFDIIQVKKKKYSKKNERKRKNEQKATMKLHDDNNNNNNNNHRKRKKHTFLDKEKNFNHNTTSSFKYNFVGAEFLDHFETPFIAYKDIESTLSILAKKLKKDRKELRIYDPYYCRGTVKNHLKKMGYTNIYNENEDFYTSSRFKDFSLFDIVITNPPYSSNHKERCMKWLRKTKKPFFCLMWKFAANKKWYREGLSNQINTKDLYIYPKDKTRYNFKNPSGKGIHGGSPYVPLWFINTSSVINTSTILHMIPKVTALCIENILRGNVNKKRGNPRQRKKAAAARRKKQQKAYQQI